MRRTMLDMETYPRRAHFDYFRALPFPCVGMKAEADVTALVPFCRDRGVSFSLTFTHLCARAADRVPEFRRRICGGGIAEYDACGTSHTEARPDGTYGYCTLWHDLPFDEYIPYAEKQQAACRAGTGIGEDEDADALYFVSAIPWVRYTDLTQPAACGDESNPRISWGKYAPDFRGRLMMPVTVLLHHALADGMHLGLFYRNLEEEIGELTGTAAKDTP